jgi:hypothetical protein
VFVKVRHVCLAVGGGDGRQGWLEVSSSSLAFICVQHATKSAQTLCCGYVRDDISLEVLRTTWPQASEYNTCADRV